MANNPKHMENLKPFKEGEDKRRANNGRKPTKFLTQLLIKELKGKKEIEIEGYEINTGAKTKIKVPLPTKQTIIQALLRQAAKGNVNAIKEVLDRVEGKTLQPVGLQDKDGNDIPLNIILQPQPNCEPLKDAE